ncbi:DUF982 domain-containing protein [Rhizobium puerariae]|uniref:DUF982 domain-containing protein n=1 Tax=Rhizobium puerariae TaxID=1585791 RepID=A0ABV6AG15_9HYPH
MKSNSLHQFRPVGLVMHDLGQYRVVHSVEETAEVLLREWPADDGEDFCEAVKTCFEGMHDKATPDAVRAALIKAAREVNVMVIE